MEDMEGQTLEWGIQDVRSAQPPLRRGNGGGTPIICHRQLPMRLPSGRTGAWQQPSKWEKP